MQVIFCTDCGGKNEYSGPKPKFCSSCGSPVSKDADHAKNKKNKKPKLSAAKKGPASFKEQMEVRKKEREFGASDETDIDYVPNISSLEYEIIKDGNNIYNFNDIIDVAEKNPEE
jgi:hypothetical protein